ncbi:NADP-specific glutamate dehydrogenase [Fusarium oxysporum f. sp. albedinis]|nr:NADP-specific glutamate dehydrogenase [Fusarium oxysporum f. sp. albedinis]
MFVRLGAEEKNPAETLECDSTELFHSSAGNEITARIARANSLIGILCLCCSTVSSFYRGGRHLLTCSQENGLFQDNVGLQVPSYSRYSIDPGIAPAKVATKR